MKNILAEQNKKFVLAQCASELTDIYDALSTIAIRRPPSKDDTLARGAYEAVAALHHHASLTLNKIDGLVEVAERSDESKKPAKTPAKRSGRAAQKRV